MISGLEALRLQNCLLGQRWQRRPEDGVIRALAHDFSLAVVGPSLPNWLVSACTRNVWSDCDLSDPGGTVGGVRYYRAPSITG